MADNQAVYPGDTGTAFTVAADEIAGAKYQRIKLIHGDDGINDGDVSSANPLPVSLAAAPLPTDAATEAKQDAGNTLLNAIATSVDNIDSKVSAANTNAVVLAAGTAAIGKLVANSGVVIGSVEIAAAQTVAAVTTVSTVTSLTQFNGNVIDTNSGNKSAGTLRVVLASDQPVVPVSDNAGSLTVDAPVGTPVFVRLSDGTDPLATLPVSLASVPSHAVTNAGTFAVQAALNTAVIDNAGTALTPKFAKIAASSSGNNAIVAAVTSKKIRVLAYNLIGNGAVNGKFQSDGAGTPVDLTGLKYIAAAGGGICAPFNPVGWFESASGKSLDLNLSGAVAVGGEIVYVEV